MHTGWCVGFATFKEYTQCGAYVHVMKVDRSHFLTSSFDFNRYNIFIKKE